MPELTTTSTGVGADQQAPIGSGSIVGRSLDCDLYRRELADMMKTGNVDVQIIRTEDQVEENERLEASKLFDHDGSRGVDRIRKEDVRGTLQVEWIRHGGGRVDTVDKGC